MTSLLRSSFRRLAVAAGVAALPVAMAGCQLGPPTDCRSTARLDTVTWCDGGVWTDLGGASHSTVVAGYSPGVFGGLASMSFGATESVNAHAIGGMQLTVDEADPDGIAEGFGVGTFDTAAGDLTLTLYDSSGQIPVTRGSVTVTRYEVTSDPQRAGQLDHLSATFEVDSARGHLTGEVRVS